MVYRRLDIDNGVFETIRREVVAQGYLPDINSYVGTEEEISDQYNAAKAAIISNGKQIIEVFNVGQEESAGASQYNNIVVSFISESNSKTGVGKQIDFVKVEGEEKYKKFQATEGKNDITYQVTYITQSEEYAEILRGILRKCFSIRKYIYATNDQGQNIGPGFWIFRGVSFDTSDRKYIERGYRYEARNIDLEGPTEIGEVSELKDFKFTIAEVKHKEDADINITEIDVPLD